MQIHSKNNGLYQNGLEVRVLGYALSGLHHKTKTKSNYWIRFIYQTSSKKNSPQGSNQTAMFGLVSMVWASRLELEL